MAASQPGGLLPNFANPLKVSSSMVDYINEDLVLETIHPPASASDLQYYCDQYGTFMAGKGIKQYLKLFIRVALFRCDLKLQRNCGLRSRSGRVIIMYLNCYSDLIDQSKNLIPHNLLPRDLFVASKRTPTAIAWTFTTFMGLWLSFFEKAPL